MKLCAKTLRYAAEQVSFLAAYMVGNTKTDGTRDSVVYEQGIGCEQAAKMLNRIAELTEAQEMEVSEIVKG